MEKGEEMLELLQNKKELIIYINLIIHYYLLIGVIWSVVFPKKRIWPPPNRKSWQYQITWGCFYAAFSINGLLLYLDWNSWIVKDYARLYIGVPLTLVGLWLLIWGISTIGIKNTSGLKDGFFSKRTLSVYT